MANVIVEESSLSAIADAIRTKNGLTDTYKPAEMSDAIEALNTGGITPTGTISITSNNTYDVTNYASADVNVPTGTTPTGTKSISITANGTTTEDVTDYASAEITVNVPSSSTLGTKSITANGTYNASNDSLDGYSSVTVNVPSGGGNLASGSVTPSSSSRNLSFDVGFEPSGLYVYALKADFPTDSTWKILLVGWNSTDGGGRVIRYSTGTWGAGNVAVGALVYSSGTATLTLDYNFYAGVTYYWVAW